MGGLYGWGARKARDRRELVQEGTGIKMCKILVARGHERFTFAEFCNMEDKLDRAADWIRRGYRVMFK